MKKNYVVLSMIALVALVAGCKKDAILTELPATIEQYSGGAKVYIDGSNYACWNNEDDVKVNGNAATVSSTGTGNASISGITTASEYYAVYPASCVTDYPSSGTYSVTLPAEQTYHVDGNSHQIVDGVMAAYGTTALPFKNLTALVKVTYTNNSSNSITVQKITVSTTSADLYLAGSGSVTVSSTGNHTLSLTTGSQSVSLININKEIEGWGSAYFYVVVPAFAGKDIRVDVLTTQGNFYTKKSSSATLNGNEMGLLAITTGNLDEDHGVSNGHEWIKINDVKWATCNIGANTPEEFGYYFSWGNVNGENLNGSGSYVFSSENYTPTSGASLTVDIPANNSYDAAKALWGGNWRMPTATEMPSLGSGTAQFSPATEGRYWVSSSGLRLFLPCAHQYDGSTLSSDQIGYYWTSHISDEQGGYYSFDLDGTGSITYSNRYYGHPIRPVLNE